MLSRSTGLGVALLGLGGLIGSVPLAAQPGPAPARPGGVAIAVQADMSGSQLAARAAGLLKTFRLTALYLTPPMASIPHCL